MLKLLPEGIIKELKKSTDINFEKDSYAQIQEVVKTIVHSHMNSSAPMDVEKKSLHNLEQKEENCMQSQDGQERFDPQSALYFGMKDQAEAQCLYDEEGGFLVLHWQEWTRRLAVKRERQRKRKRKVPR